MMAAIFNLAAMLEYLLYLNLKRLHLDVYLVNCKHITGNKLLR